MKNNYEDKNWERVLKLLRDADCVPDAPDCRSIVMKQISPQERKRSFVWAYACAAVVLAVIGNLIIFSRPALKTPAVKMVQKKSAMPKLNTQLDVPKDRIITTATVTEKHTPVTRHRNYIRKHIVNVPAKIDSPRRVIVSQELVAIKTVPQPIEKPKLPIANNKQPIAIAIATWSSQEKSDTSCDYSYVDRDTITGETTECKVKRSGDSINIYIESKPDDKKLPMKGSIQHETTPNVQFIFMLCDRGNRGNHCLRAASKGSRRSPNQSGLKRCTII